MSSSFNIFDKFVLSSRKMSEIAIVGLSFANKWMWSFVPGLRRLWVSVICWDIRYQSLFEGLFLQVS